MRLVWNKGISPIPAVIPAIDGAVSTTVTAANGTTLTLSTTGTNEPVFVVVVGATFPGSVTVGALTLALRASTGTINSNASVFWALAPSPLSGATVTVNWSGTRFMSVWAFGVTKANSSLVFDGNSLLPVQTTSDPASFSTNSNGDLVLAVVGTGGVIPTPGVPSGFTAIAGPNTNYEANCCYQVMPTQINQSLSFGINGTAAIIIDAILHA